MMHHFNKTVGLASTVMTMTLGSGQEEQMHLSSTGQKGMMQLQTQNVLYSVKLAGLKTTVRTNSASSVFTTTWCW